MRLVFGIVPIALFLALAVGHCVRAGVQPDDSGFIALGVADHLRQGGGIAFNAGERRDLVDSPLWLGVLSVLSLSSQAPALVQAAGLALGTAILLLVLAGARLPVTGACASLFLGLDGLFAAGATGGGSGLAAALYLLALYLLLGSARGRGPAPSEAERILALWASIAVLVRYELVLVAVPATLGWALTDRRRLHAWMPFGFAVGGACLWLAVRWAYFHALPAYWEPWPPSAATWRAGVQALAAQVLHRPLLLLGLLVLLSGWMHGQSRAGRSSGLGWGLFALAAFSTLPAAGSDVGRQTVAILPLIYLLAVEAVWRGARTRLALVAALLLVVAQPAWTRNGHTRSDASAAYAPLGQWLRTHALPGTVLGARQVGALGYYSGLKTEDVLGRVSPRVAAARRLQPVTSFDAADSDFGPMLRQEPDLVLVGAHEPVPPATLYIPNDEALPQALRGGYSIYRWAGSPVWRLTQGTSSRAPG